MPDTALTGCGSVWYGRVGLGLSVGTNGATPEGFTRFNSGTGDWRSGLVRRGLAGCGMARQERGCQRHNTGMASPGSIPGPVAGWVRRGLAGSGSAWYGLSMGTNGATLLGEFDYG